MVVNFHGMVVERRNFGRGELFCPGEAPENKERQRDGVTLFGRLKNE
jgi:hypothetical protein